MPSIVDGRLTGNVKSPTHLDFDKIIEQLEKEQTSRKRELAQIEAEGQNRQNAGLTQDEEFRRLISRKEELELGISTTEERRASVTREFLIHTIDECIKKRENILPMLFLPTGWWDYAQTILDHWCIEKGIPLADTRHKPEYRQHGIWPNNMFALDEKTQKEKREKEEAEIPPEERIRAVPGFRNHCPWENEKFFFNGHGEVTGFEIKVSCGPRLCGHLNERKDDCVHNPTTRCLKWQPEEWKFHSGWRGGMFGNPFKVRHTPHSLGPVWEPIWDFNDRGEWVQLRDVPDELKDCDWVKGVR